MTHFLDTLPFDFSTPPAKDMLAFLTDTYYQERRVMALAQAAGVRLAAVPWGQPMYVVWPQLVEQARNQGKLRALLAELVNGADAAVAAKVSEWLEADPPISAPTPASTGLVWKADGDDGLERQIFVEPTLLDVAFLRRGAELAAAVCRLRVTMPSSAEFLGTAFRIGDGLLLTNHHVLYEDQSDGKPATAVEAWFGYERTFEGQELAHHVVHGDARSIRGDATHDWAIIETTMPFPADTPTLSLTGSGHVAPADRVYIIQHPQGAPKKIGMIHNVVRHVDDDVVQYLTDTEQGSSGAPVFDEQWQLVALHHSSIAHKAGGVLEHRNQGRRIERVAEGLSAAGVV